MARAHSVQFINPAELKPYERNARKHSKKQVAQIAESIQRFGFNNPVLMDGDNVIIAGHGRVQAALRLGLDKVPTLQVTHLTDAQKRAYILADNRLAEKAGWDEDILAIELQFLVEAEVEFDVTVTGFDMGEVDLLLQEEEDDTDDKNIPLPPPTPVTQLGDLWQLGDHLVYCGNSLEHESYTKLLGDQKAAMVFTDPPYNVPINGHVSGKGETRHEEFAMAVGEMTPEQFTGFLRQACELLAEFSTTGSLHFICMDWRHLRELLTAGESVYAELKNICVWNKDRGGMGALYRSKHELVALFKNGTGPHVNNVELGKHGRYRTNVWNYPAISALTGDKLAMHPTVKPVKLIADVLLDCSNPGDIVLDVFGGSGSTLIAAERKGRKARLIELEGKYVDTTILRWQKATGSEAVHVATGQTFALRANQREAQ
jgi:DNA modification methylase